MVLYEVRLPLLELTVTVGRSVILSELKVVESTVIGSMASTILACPELYCQNVAGTPA